MNLNSYSNYNQRGPNWPHTHPCGLRSNESSTLCWKLGEPRSAVLLFAGVGDEVLMVEVHKLVVLPGQAFGGLVTKKLSDSERFFTWCITPGTTHRNVDYKVLKSQTFLPHYIFFANICQNGKLVYEIHEIKLIPSLLKYTLNTSGSFCMRISAICREPTTIFRSWLDSMEAM